MTTRQPKVHTQLGRAAVQIFAANDRMNQLLIEHLDPAAWRAKPPGKVRTIAAIFTHMHNVRTKWIRLTAPHLKVPAQLNRTHCTPQQARAGLAESAARCGRDARGSARRWRGPRREVSQRRLGQALAGWRGNAVLHACSRSPPSRAGAACWRINSDFRCRPRWRPGCGIGKSCGKSAGRLAAPAAIRRESLN